MKKRGGFSLIEVAVVVGIVVVLAAVLLPVFARAKESALITESALKQRQFHQAFMLYQADHGGHTGAFGPASASNLPNHHYFGEPLKPYGITIEFRKTPCGSKAPFGAGWIASHVSDELGTSWVVNSPIYRENSLMIFDDNCNPGNEAAYSPHKLKRGLGILYSGAVIRKWNTGDASEFKFYANPPE